MRKRVRIETLVDRVSDDEMEEAKKATASLVHELYEIAAQAGWEVVRARAPYASFEEVQ